MIDIHCHPLPGIDDGAKSFEVAVGMCRVAAVDGISHLVATPHCNFEYSFDPALNRQLLGRLQETIGEKPQLLLGCDFQLSYDNIQRCVERAKDFTINQTSYLLVELPDQFIPDHMNRVYFDIQKAGLTPIISHPERNLAIRRRPELIPQWVSNGCLMQVTAMSFTGGFGSQARKFADRLFQNGLIHFFASDAHNLRERPPILSRCYRKVAKARGEEIADLLMRKNPEAVIHGRPLPPQPNWAQDPSEKGKRR
jgi:protein-tyrosine phosphatase